jgi:hypothetical protein
MLTMGRLEETSFLGKFCPQGNIVLGKMSSLKILHPWGDIVSKKT